MLPVFNPVSLIGKNITANMLGRFARRGDLDNLTEDVAIIEGGIVL